jgi:predicted membrane protein
MQDRPTGRTQSPPRLVLGLMVMALGLALTLENLGWMEARRLVRFWPLILVAMGVARLAESMRNRTRPSGVLWILFGLALLLHNLRLLDLHRLWPLFIFALGAGIFFRSFGVKRPGEWTAVADSSGDVFAFMGGVRRASNAQDFKALSASAIMGGCEIDLTQASMAGDEAVLDGLAIWGGVEVRVPPDWAIDNRGVAILGSFEDKTRPAMETKKKLVLKGLAFMGGVEVKN